MKSFKYTEKKNNNHIQPPLSRNKQKLYFTAFLFNIYSLCIFQLTENILHFTFWGFLKKYFIVLAKQFPD